MIRRFTLAALAALLFLALPLAAAELTATVTKITGKAELQKGSSWVALALGQVLPIGATVSTGFRSELQLKIGPSTVTVKALSRLILKDLVQTGTEAKTDLYLTVGKIDAEVNKSEAVTAQTFTVASPVSTASVRGTAFSYDGVRVTVTRGLVDLHDLRGNVVQVPVGEAAQASTTGGSQGIATPRDIETQDSTVQANSGSDYGQTDGTWDSYSYSLDGWDYWSILDSLDSYDWAAEYPNTYIWIGGIAP